MGLALLPGPVAGLLALSENFLGIVSSLILFLALLYVQARLSVALPWSAVGEVVWPRDAWELSHGAGLALFFVVVLAAAATGILLIPLTFLLKVLHGRAGVFGDLLTPFWEARGLLIATVEIAALSLSFRHLKRARAA